MWIVLSPSQDESAVWAAEGLRRRGLEPLAHITAECLAFSRAWEHRVGSDGAHVKVALQDGRVVCSSRIRGVLNRLGAPSLDLAAHSAAADREYASCELQAFYLSWLHALPGVVVNRPSPLGLAGAWRHTSEWAIRAARAGFAVPPYRQTTSDPAERGYAPLTPAGVAPVPVIVLRDKIFGAQIPETLRAACIRLARAERVEILGIDLFQDRAGAWTFGHAAPSPWLPPGGEPLLDYMADLLQNGDPQ